MSGFRLRSDRWRSPTAMRVTGWFFAIGSACFFVPAVAALTSQASWIDVTFFVGSIFFTTAALLQLLAAASVPHGRHSDETRTILHPQKWWEPHADWVAAAVQFVGTLFFNVNTWNAMDAALTLEEANRRVWVPDAVGSVCFLVASVVALVIVQHRWMAWEPRDPDWKIGVVNLLGSIAFGIAAIAAFGRPATGDLVDDRLANTGTAAGAICFFVGAVLLALEGRAEARRQASAERPGEVVA